MSRQSGLAEQRLPGGDRRSFWGSQTALAMLGGAVVAAAMVATVALVAGCQGTREAIDKTPTLPLASTSEQDGAQRAPGAGEQALDFSLMSVGAGEVRLSEVLARNDSVVLVFYRGFF